VVTSIGITDTTAWDYSRRAANGYVQRAGARGLRVHLWTFKDDVLLFGASNSTDMYRVATNMRLDGIITEFPDTLAALQPFLKA
jgi:glycerophosphoryl diester phosphodiesterase